MDGQWSLRTMLKEIYGIGPEMKEKLEALLERILQIMKNEGEET